MIKLNNISKLNKQLISTNKFNLQSYKKFSSNFRVHLKASSLILKNNLEIEEDIKKILKEHEDLKLKKEVESNNDKEVNKGEVVNLKEEVDKSENIIILEAPKDIIKEESKPKVEESKPIELPAPDSSTKTEETQTTNDNPLQTYLKQLEDSINDLNQKFKDKKEELKNIDWEVYKQKFYDLLKLIGVNLNQVTGYDQIERLKNNIKVYELEFEKINQELKRVKSIHEENINLRANGQKEINNLLQRKHSWMDEDVTNFTQLYRNEHRNEQNEFETKQKLKDLEDQVEITYAKLIDSIRTRYHEEQLWSDKIRGASTYWTLALIMINLLAFILVHTWLEPRKRRRMVEQVSIEMNDMLKKMESDLNDKLGPLESTINNQKSIIIAVAQQLDDVDYKLTSSPKQDNQAISAILSELLRPSNEVEDLTNYQSTDHPVIQGIKNADPVILSVASALIGSLITLSMTVFLY